MFFLLFITFFARILKELTLKEKHSSREFCLHCNTIYRERYIIPKNDLLSNCCGEKWYFPRKLHVLYLLLVLRSCTKNISQSMIEAKMHHGVGGARSISSTGSFSGPLLTERSASWVKPLPIQITLIDGSFCVYVRLFKKKKKQIQRKDILLANKRR